MENGEHTFNGRSNRSPKAWGVEFGGVSVLNTEGLSYMSRKEFIKEYGEGAKIIGSSNNKPEVR